MDRQEPCDRLITGLKAGQDSVYLVIHERCGLLPLLVRLDTIVLRERLTGAVLFMGVVNDPTG
jgi:hypothetical protein